MQGQHPILDSSGWTIATAPSAEGPRWPEGGLVPLLERLLEACPRSFLRRVPGRETFASRDLPELPVGWIIKRFGRGSRRDDWHERLRGQPVRSPARREFENLLALRALGLRVPQAILWARRGSGARAPSLLVMSEILHGPSLRARLAEPDAPDCLAELLEMVARLHAAGWYHRDLYLQHFVPAAGERGLQLYLLDLGRCRRGHPPRRRWFEKDLAALLHSCPPAVSARRRLRFLTAYLDRRGLARGRAGGRERRRWARAIELRRARMAAHRPRFGEEEAAS